MALAATRRARDAALRDAIRPSTTRRSPSTSWVFVGIFYRGLFPTYPNDWRLVAVAQAAGPPRRARCSRRWSMTPCVAPRARRHRPHGDGRLLAQPRAAAQRRGPRLPRSADAAPGPPVARARAPGQAGARRVRAGSGGADQTAGRVDGTRRPARGRPRGRLARPPDGRSWPGH